jgi:hypothetical protein
MRILQSARRRIRRRPCILACAAIAALSPLFGCGEDEYKPVAKKAILADSTATDLAPAPATIQVPPLPGGDLRTDLGIASESYGDYSNRDMVDKADIFWKLYYMTKELQQGGTPRNLTAEFDALNNHAKKLHPDKNVAAIIDVLKEVRTGLDARNLGQRLARREIRVESLPWTGGGYAIERALKSPDPSPAGRPKPPAATSADSRIAADWATRHHNSPLMVQQESFSRAADLTAQLGDSLDDERRQAGEHPIGREKVVPGAGLGNPYDSMFPSRPVR